MNKINNTEIEIDKRDKTETAQVIVKFTNWAARSNAYSLHYSKTSTIRVKTDLTKYRQELLTTARVYLKDHYLHGYVYSDANCNLVLKNIETNRRHIFTNFPLFKSFADVLAVNQGFHKPAYGTLPD